MHRSGSTIDLNEATGISYEATHDCEATFKECDEGIDLTRRMMRIAAIKIDEGIRGFKRGSITKDSTGKSTTDAAEVKEYGKANIQTRKAAARTANAVEPIQPESQQQHGGQPSRARMYVHQH